MNGSRSFGSIQRSRRSSTILGPQRVSKETGSVDNEMSKKSTHEKQEEMICHRVPKLAKRDHQRRDKLDKVASMRARLYAKSPSGALPPTLCQRVSPDVAALSASRVARLLNVRLGREAAAANGGAERVELLPVTVAEAEAPTASPVAALEPIGRMEIVLSGGERIIVGMDVDATALARVVRTLTRR